VGFGFFACGKKGLATDYTDLHGLFCLQQKGWPVDVAHSKFYFLRTEIVEVSVAKRFPLGIKNTCYND
jgi:hypothetical protein